MKLIHIFFAILVWTSTTFYIGEQKIKYLRNNFVLLLQTCCPLDFIGSAAVTSFGNHDHSYLKSNEIAYCRGKDLSSLFNQCPMGCELIKLMVSKTAKILESSATKWCKSHRATTLRDDSGTTVSPDYCAHAFPPCTLRWCCGLLRGKKKGSFYLYSCDWNPSLSGPFVSREWTWPVVKSRHPFLCTPRNSHSDAAEQEGAHSQWRSVTPRKPPFSTGSPSNSFQPARLVGYSC